MKQQIWLSPPHLSGKELGYIQQAFTSNYITSVGENINRFEQAICDYTKARYAVALSCGTAAIHLALIAAEVQQGDEVLCSAFTFVASANPIMYLKAVPVFVESEPHSWNMSPEFLEEAIKSRLRKGRNPKAVVVAHLYGQPAKIDEICAIADKYGITVIEDSAESLGSWYKGRHTGTFGKAGIFSFNGNKIITTSGGGALITNDKAVADQARFLAAQARDAAPYYQHSQLGYNYRMSNILAGIGLGQMELLPERIAKRRSNFEYYKNAFKGVDAIRLPCELPEGISNRWLTCMVVDKHKSEVAPTAIIKALEAEQIEARHLWKPMQEQPLYKEYPYYGDGLSEHLFQSGLCLPSGSQLTEADLQRIVEVVRNLFN